MGRSKYPAVHVFSVYHEKYWNELRFKLCFFQISCNEKSKKCQHKQATNAVKNLQQISESYADDLYMITAGKVLNYVGRGRGGGTREISFFPSEIV